jgi:PIN domain nuclease of toxin-antitoxin system
MKLLLDTHAFVWADGEPEKLSSRAKAACEDPANELVLSAVSVWEMQLKLMLGKLTLRKPLRPLIMDWVEQNGLVIWPIQLEHVLRLDTLTSHHKDPFDRLLIAQAMTEGCSIVSHDRIFPLYSVQIIW